MTSKITPDHLSRAAVVYVRQSTMGQVTGNLESRRRQYDLAGAATAAGFASTMVIDEDLGRSGSRFCAGAPLDGSGVRAAAGCAPTAIRSDVRVPVLMFITETDLLMPGMAYLPARQEDGPRIRTWEVAGTAHADTYTLLGGVLDTGSVSPETLARASTPKAEMFAISLSKPINAAPQHHYVAQAALGPQ